MAPNVLVAYASKHGTREVAEPIAVTIFGGALRPEDWRFPLNRLPAFDARDWDAIRRWACEVAAKLTPVSV